MSWIAISDHESSRFSIRGLGNRSTNPALISPVPGALMPRGSLVIETRLPNTRRPKPLLFYNHGGDWPMHLSLQSIPGGGVTFILDQGGHILHKSLNNSEAGRTDVLRITYSWDSPRGVGQLALERTDQEDVLLVPLVKPKPLRVFDLLALFESGKDRYLSPEVQYLALSDQIEPVGPTPTLLASTLVATPRGYRKVGDLKRGDTVLSGDNQVVPVLHKVSRQVAAMGSFAPVRLRAPYFGLKQDIVVAPGQRIVLSGSEVEYLFGQEAVLVPARHLVGGRAVRPVDCPPVVTYSQLILPEHETLMAAGTIIESLYIGRIRRKPQKLAASILADLDRATLPDHRGAIYQVLKPFDALILAEQRAA